MPRPSARSVLTLVAVAAPRVATWRAEVAIRWGTEPIRVSLVKKP